LTNALSAKKRQRHAEIKVIEQTRRDGKKKKTKEGTRTKRKKKKRQGEKGSEEVLGGFELLHDSQTSQGCGGRVS